MMRIRCAALALSLLAAGAASAQVTNVQTKADPLQRVPLMAIGCLDANGLFVPATAAGVCAGGGGTGTANQGAPNGGGTAAWWVQWSGMSVAVSNFPTSFAVTNAGTFPVQVTSSALPSGAATSAKQPAPGTAGSPSADVLSIQGVAGGTPQPMTTTNGALETGGNLAALLARTPPLGQTAKAASQPVVLPSDMGPLATTPNACSITPAIVSGTGGTLIAANASRKSLRWMNVGASDVTVAPGTAAPVVGQGMVYASTAAGKQGGGETFNDTAVATNAFAYAASATATVAVWECQ